MTREPDLYVGKEPAMFAFEGSTVFVGPNTVIRAGHPIMRGREHLFTPLVVHFDLAPREAGTTEQATAAPGELRDVLVPEGESKSRRTRKPADPEPKE